MPNPDYYCAFNTFWRCPDEAITKGIKPCQVHKEKAEGSGIPGYIKSWVCPIAIKPEEDVTMSETDAIAALEQAAQEAGCHLDITSNEDRSSTEKSLKISSPNYELQVGIWGGDDEEIIVDAAHALIAFWKRRGWVPCHHCKGLKAAGEWVLGKDGYAYVITNCPTCHGVGRVPPDG